MVLAHMDPFGNPRLVPVSWVTRPRPRAVEVMPARSDMIMVRKLMES